MKRLIENDESVNVDTVLIVCRRSLMKLWSWPYKRIRKEMSMRLPSNRLVLATHVSLISLEAEMVYKTIVPYFFQMGEHVQHYAGGSISDDFF